MKKYTFILLLLLSVSLPCYAQKQNGSIYYTEIESVTEPGANAKSFNAVLHFTPEKAIYVSAVDSLENGGKKIAKTIQSPDGGVKTISTQSSAKGLFNVLDRKSNLIISNARFNYNITYTEPLPRMEWKVTSEQKLIEGVKVIKATTSFRGRNYTAWFAPEYPIPLGP